LITKRIIRLTATIYSGKDWHQLTQEERELVGLLQELGYIISNNPDDGFVGKACLTPPEKQHF